MELAVPWANDRGCLAAGRGAAGADSTQAVTVDALDLAMSGQRCSPAGASCGPREQIQEASADSGRAPFPAVLLLREEQGADRRRDGPVPADGLGRPDRRNAIGSGPSWRVSAARGGLLTGSISRDAGSVERTPGMRQAPWSCTGRLFGAPRRGQQVAGQHRRLARTTLAAPVAPSCTSAARGVWIRPFPDAGRVRRPAVDPARTQGTRSIPGSRAPSRDCLFMRNSSIFRSGRPVDSRTVAAGVAPGPLVDAEMYAYRSATVRAREAPEQVALLQDRRQGTEDGAVPVRRGLGQAHRPPLPGQVALVPAHLVQQHRVLPLFGQLDGSGQAGLLLEGALLAGTQVLRRVRAGRNSITRASSSRKPSSLATAMRWLPSITKYSSLIRYSSTGGRGRPSRMARG